MKYSIFSVNYYQAGREDTNKQEYGPNSHVISFKSMKIQQFLTHDVIVTADLLWRRWRMEVKTKIEFSGAKYCRCHMFYQSIESTDKFLVAGYSQFYSVIDSKSADVA